MTPRHAHDVSMTEEEALLAFCFPDAYGENVAPEVLALQVYTVQEVEEEANT